MALAMESVTYSTTSINKAAELHGISKTTENHLSGQVKPGSPPGPKPYLLPSKEKVSAPLLTALSIALGRTMYEVMRIIEGY